MFLTKITLFIIIITLRTAILNSVCSINTRSPKYYLIEKCYVSKLGIVAKANFTSIKSCQELGKKKNALALNFSPPEAWNASRESLEYTCEVLKCTESDGGQSLINDTRYDYYSMYAKPLPHVNSSCIPTVGMFYLVMHMQNYTLAARECKNITALPADVTSEHRTDALAQFLTGTSVDVAFVGLRSKNGSAFISPNGNSLDCTTYRAWAPGHPRRHRNKFDCVLLTRQRTWRTVSCNESHPMLCELKPGGPYKTGSIFFSRDQKNNETNKYNDEE